MPTNAVNESLNELLQFDLITMGEESGDEQGQEQSEGCRSCSTFCSGCGGTVTV